MDNLFWLILTPLLRASMAGYPASLNFSSPVKWLRAFRPWLPPVSVYPEKLVTIKPKSLVTMLRNSW
jgi:hypothetical protein